MNRQTDQQLLAVYVQNRSEAAFAELVRRHVDFVYSAALRMVRDTHLAEDVTQGVFIAFANSAPQLREHPVLSGWLHRSARNLAAQTVRTIERRRVREQEAVAMNVLAAESENSWAVIAPHLDAALGELTDADRDALLLRYFEKKSALEMAGILGISDEAAQKRVSRAVERLREAFLKRNVTIGASGLAVLITTNALHSAPLGMATAISVAALAGTAASSTIALTKAIAMTTLQKTLLAAAVAVLAGAGIYQYRHVVTPTKEQQQKQLAEPSPAPRHEANDVAALLAIQNKDDGPVTNSATPKPGPADEQAGAAANMAPPREPAGKSKLVGLELPKDAWADAGFATPEAALKTRGWAVVNGNRERFAESLAVTPGARKMLEDMLIQMASASTDPDRDRMIQEALKNKWGVEEGMLMPMMALNQQKVFSGYRVLAEQSPAPDVMVLELETDMSSAPPHQDTLKMQLFGGDWKVVIDEEMLKSMR